MAVPRRDARDRRVTMTRYLFKAFYTAVGLQGVFHEGGTGRK